MNELNKILYVEDELDIQAVAGLALEAVGGFCLKVCSSGEEALQHAESFEPDMILLDVMMPGMDGPTTLKALREIPSLAEIPIAFMTAKVQPLEVAFYKAQGAQGVISKPFDPMNLANQVRAIWDTSQQPVVPRVNIFQQLQQLRQTYQQRLRQELSDLEVLVAGLASQESPQHVLQELNHRLHKLTGSGGTFGLPELSLAARQLQDHVQAAQAQDQNPIDKNTWQRLVSGVAGLKDRPKEGLNMETLLKPSDLEEPLKAEKVEHIWLLTSSVQAGEDLMTQLKSFNYQVRLFDTLVAIEAQAKGQVPKMLLVDLESTQDAFGRSRILRNLKCPRIFLSEQEGFQARMHAAQLGSDGYFTKPLDVSRLANYMDQLFEQQRFMPQRVLIVDDDEMLVEYYRLVLEMAGMEVVTVTQCETLLDTMFAFNPELVLLDLELSHWSGPDLARVIRQHEHWTSQPIVYLSAESSLDKRIQAMNRGADDFLSKPISEVQLAAAVRLRVDRSRQLSAQMTKDSLTGLLKHANIKDAAQIELARAQRNGTGLAAAMLDIDHFKAVNDTYGHATGDIVISAVAMILRQRVRQSDIVGRYGGEEFLVILPDCELASAHRILEDIRSSFAALRFTCQQQEFSCTLSVGLASSRDYPECSSHNLVALADKALYVAKANGRNCIKEAPKDLIALSELK